MNGRCILWPRRVFVDAEQIITWAREDVSDGRHDGPSPETLDDAIAVIVETGTLTVKAEA